MTTSTTRRWSAARASLAFAVSLAASSGCSSNTGGTDAATTDAPARDTGSDTAHADVDVGVGNDGPPTCNALTLTGVAAATGRGSGASAPTPAGGTVADGTYWLSEAVYYGQPSLAPFALMRAKIVIAGATMQTVQGDPEPGGINPDRTFTDSISVGTTTLVITPVCPPTNGAPFTAGFTVAAGGGGADAAGGGAATLTLFAHDAAGTTGLVYARQ